jgi:hypothetical protein
MTSWRVMSHHVYMAEHERDPFPDRTLLGVVVRQEISRQHASVSNFVKHAPKVSRKTVERIRGGDPSVERESIEYVESSLGLPRDTFDRIAHHDIQGMREIGVEPDLVRWVGQEITKKQGPMGSNVSAAI